MSPSKIRLVATFKIRAAPHRLDSAKLPPNLKRVSVGSDIHLRRGICLHNSLKHIMKLPTCICISNRRAQDVQSGVLHSPSHQPSIIIRVNAKEHGNRPYHTHNTKPLHIRHLDRSGCNIKSRHIKTNRNNYSDGRLSCASPASSSSSSSSSSGSINQVKPTQIKLTTMDPPPYTASLSAETAYTPDEHEGSRADPVSSLLRSNTLSSQNRSRSSSSLTVSTLVAEPTPEDISRASSITINNTEDKPPTYAPLDDQIRTFKHESPLIYTTSPNTMARYHLHQETTEKGRARKLSIRKLLPTEARSCSVHYSSSNDTRSAASKIVYDDDLTLYSITAYDNFHVVGLPYHYEIKGHRSRTLPGKIKVEIGAPSWIKRQRSFKFVHYTRSLAKDSLNPANEARMQKYGYKSEQEWNRRSLFTVKTGCWVDGEGTVVAREDQEGGLKIVDGIWEGKEWIRQRDLIVACWAFKKWVMAVK
ncbi:unnamed protein product [Periconia digitata]|uniref:Uncharacterized protein n=1 Tax=Periconia digitata TaxID=1303443 RepID=A0A9W4U966_9PLEO|nr:unnamed protein product [Periconia digitata]